jgi:hypothetical protein
LIYLSIYLFVGASKQCRQFATPPQNTWSYIGSMKQSHGTQTSYREMQVISTPPHLLPFLNTATNRTHRPGRSRECSAYTGMVQTRLLVVTRGTAEMHGCDPDRRRAPDAVSLQGHSTLPKEPYGAEPLKRMVRVNNAWCGHNAPPVWESWESKFPEEFKRVKKTGCGLVRTPSLGRAGNQNSPAGQKELPLPSPRMVSPTAACCCGLLISGRDPGMIFKTTR